MLRRGEVARLRESGEYTLIRVGRVKLSESGYIQIPTLPERSGEQGRNVQFFLGQFFDPNDPNRQFDVYLSVKDAGDGRSLLVDRMVLGKVR